MFVVLFIFVECFIKVYFKKMSDSSNDEINNLPIKRKRGVVNKNLRKANVRKLERCAGCEYINQKGKTVLARKQKVPCQ